MSDTVASTKTHCPMAYTPLGMIALLAAMVPAAARAAGLGTLAALLVGAQPQPLVLQQIAMLSPLPGPVASLTPAPLVPHTLYSDDVDAAGTATAMTGISVMNALPKTPASDTTRMVALVTEALPHVLAEPSGEALCLTNAVYFEARSEPLDGQLAVAQVVLDRLADPRYPKTICGVVYEHHPGTAAWACQFSFSCDTIPDVVNDPKSWLIAKAIAYVANERRVSDVTGGKATHYHSIVVAPEWSYNMPRTRGLGRHLFYHEPM